MAEPDTTEPPTYTFTPLSSKEEPLEERLLSAIANVLRIKRENISLLDSFVELGGEEEAAVKLRKICLDAGMTVKKADILQCQTVAELQTRVTPYPWLSTHFDCSEPIVIAPLEIHKAKSRPRHSSDSSASSSLQPKTELEQVLSRHSLVSQVTTTSPKAGLLEGQHVVFVTLTSIKPTPDNAEGDISLVSPPQVLLASTQIATLRAFVEGALGAVALPDVWVVLNQMPLTESGEVDRRSLRTWSQNINDDTYRQVMRFVSQNVLEPPSTDLERSVHRAVSKLLQIPQEHIGVNFTFTELGGNEMSAMDLVVRCEQESIHITADEVLTNATLADLALMASKRGDMVHKWNEEDSDCFELSPMQRLYFATKMGGDMRRRVLSKAGYRFNQSHLLRMMKTCMVDDIHAAIEAVVGHHPMLRSRFVHQGNKWSQRVLPDVSGSYAFSQHIVSSDDEMKAIIERSQASIDIQKGPVFGVDYIQTPDGQQMIYLVAHHLAVDLRSWRVIIHDLDELLDSGSLLSRRSMPYRKWVEVHRVAAQEMRTDAHLLPTARLNQAYWGLNDIPNSYEDAVETSFSISSELTAILQGPCNLAFQTDPADIYLASLMLSFAQTFIDRAVPVVWAQEQGRDNLTPNFDVSETVGWFTSLAPLVQEISSQDSIVDVLRKLKDNRRISSSSGALQFASRLYDSRSDETFSLDNGFEIVFSYAGCLDHLQRRNGILEQANIPGRNLGSRTSDVGFTVGRISAFEVTAMVDEGIAKVNFVFNRYSKHQERISSWISTCEHLLLELISRLRYHAQELTLSDVPCLDITYDGLDKLNKTCVDTLKLSTIRDVEAVYPVTANQQRILVSQAQNHESNIIHSVVEFVTPTGETIDTSRLCLAWQLVAARHAALRTIFVDSVTETGLYDQIVLRRASPDMLFIDAVPPDDPIDELRSLPTIDVTAPKPAHRLTLCKTPIKTMLSLEISGAICDAASVDLLLRDLWHTYSTQRPIPGPVRFSYPDYIEMLKMTRQGRSLKYWTDLLATTQPCSFPALTSRSVDGRLSHVNVEIGILSSELAAFARSQDVSNEAIVRLAWALVLRSFVGDDDICFGCSTSGRERYVDGLGNAVGSFANIVPVAVRLLPTETVGSSLRVVDEQLKSSLLYQFVVVPEIEHALALQGGTHLFNTSISYAEEWTGLNSNSRATGDLVLQPVSKQHCTSYDVSLNIRHLNGKLVLDTSSRIFPEEQTLNVANSFGVAMQAILSSVDGTPIRDVSLFSDRDYAQIVAWDGDRTDSRDWGDANVVHDLVTRHAFQNPSSQGVCAWDGDLSYQELVGAATTLAHYLVDRGVGPHAIVPVVLAKTRWAPVAMLAILKTGAAFVPVDAEELETIQSVYDQLDMKVVVTAGQGAPIGLLEDLFDEVIVLSDSFFLQMPRYNESLPSIATPDDTACVLFSSSTKDTRGYAFSHNALSATFLAQGPVLRITAKSRVMQISSFSSDVALSEILTTLTHGGCVCIPSPTRDYTIDLQRMQVNWLYMTPLLSRRLDPTLLPMLKVVCFRTHSLDEDTYGAWAGKANVVLAYGAPGVFSLGISFLNMVDASDLKSIGQPIAGKFRIVNPENRQMLMPVGAVGELIIEGPLGRKYPYQDVDEDLRGEIEVHGDIKTKCFRTGQLVRYLEDGILHLVSSRKENLEIDGRTVNRTELEMHIRRCLGHGVDVAVESIRFPGASDVPVLVAFIELGNGALAGRVDLVKPLPATSETVYMVKQLIESGLRNVVAPHLIPSIIVPVARLPITQSLKVDRLRLKQLIHGLSRKELEGLAEAPNLNALQTIGLKNLPLTHAEENFRTIMARVLGIYPATIGSTDRFLGIGGDEVLAAKLVVACRHEGLTLPITDLLRNATLTDICRSMAIVDDSTLPEPYSPIEPMQPAPQQGGSTTEDFIERVIAPKLGLERKAIKEVADTSAMQTRYIESSMLRGRANIDYFTFTFSGEIDGAKLQEACQMLGIIHPILRTCFTPHRRRVFSVVLKSFVVEFERHSCPAWKLASTTKKVIGKDQAAPIAFNRPMTKFMFLDGDKQSTLILRLSKAQYDDVSIALLVKDLKRLYSRTDHPPRRPSYCDFINRMKISNSDNAQQYWQHLLEGATLTSIIEHSKPYCLTIHAKTLRKQVSVGSLSSLGVSFETVLKSAWAMVLASLSAASDVGFGEIVDGRHVKLEDGHSVASVMGPTINTIPVRIQFPDTPLSPLELLQNVHRQRMAGLPFENMGFLEIVERCTSWPYWTRLSTVVQHQREDTAIFPREPKTFHLGSTPCTFDMLEPKAQDLPDLFVRSIMRGQGNIELRLTFSADRVLEDLANYALSLLTDTVNMLTASTSIMQPIIPSAHQYRAMQKRIPLSPTSSSGGPATAPAISEPEENKLASFIPPDQALAIQTAISKAWKTTLDPRSLGVPDEHVHRAAFYDLWGSLIPAAQLASQLNRSLPKLHLPGLDDLGITLSMEDIIDHPTMHAQFGLVAARMAAAQARPLLQKPRGQSAVESGGDRARRKPSVSVASSAATVAKGLRRLASTVARSSAPQSAGPVAPIVTAPMSGPRATEISPLSPAPQLPLLPAFSPVAPDGFAGVVAEMGDSGQSLGASTHVSSAESMTSGSMASRESEEGEGADVLDPLRSDVAGGFRLQTQGLRTADRVADVVSPLSAGSERNVRFWDGSARLCVDGASGGKRRGSAGAGDHEVLGSMGFLGGGQLG